MRLDSVAIACALGFALVSTAGCPGPRKRDHGAEIDPSSMSFLSAARALHHQADMMEDAGNPREAIEALERARTMPRGSLTREMREVLADTTARIAELRLQLGEVEQAQKSIAEGLTFADQPGYFRGHLLEVRGRVLEAEAKKLKADGHLALAETKRREALLSFDEAVRMHEDVIRSRLADGGNR